MRGYDSGKSVRKTRFDPSTEEWTARTLRYIPDLGKALLSSGDAEEIPQIPTSFSSPSSRVIHSKHDKWREEEEGSYEARGAEKLGTRIVIVLFVTSCLASATSYTIDFVIQQGVPTVMRQVLAITGGTLPDLPVEMFINVCLCWIARLCVKFRPQCAGSGIPEVKCMLSGERLENVLSYKVAMAKAVGLAMGSASGLQIGKEGPFVHIATCIGWRVVESVEYFRKLKHKLMRETILLAGVAVGVGTTFSAPISGVLLALELMMPRLYSKIDFRSCFFGAIVGSVVFMTLGMMSSGGGQLKPLLASDVGPEAGDNLVSELVFIGLCCVLGLICGALGALFVQCYKNLSLVINYFRGPGKHEGLDRLFGGLPCQGLVKSLKKIPTIYRDFTLLTILSATLSMFKYHGSTPLYGLPLPGFCNQLMLVHSPMQPTLAIILELVIVKGIMIIVSLCMPVPAGVVAPTIAFGSALGRLFGMLVPDFLRQVIDPNGDFSAYEARFAIVGSSAFSAAVCHAMAMVVTVFELLAIPRIVIPLTFATYLSVRLATFFSGSFFDVILVLKKLPGLPSLTSHHLDDETVEKAAQDTWGFESLALHRDSTWKDLDRVSQALFDLGKDAPRSIPFVERISHSERDKYHFAYLGSMRVKNYHLLCEKYEQQHTCTTAHVLRISATSRDYVDSITFHLSDGEEDVYPKENEASRSECATIDLRKDFITSVSQYGHEAGGLGTTIVFKTYDGKTHSITGSKSSPIEPGAGKGPITSSSPQHFEAEEHSMITSLKFEGSKLVGIGEEEYVARPTCDSIVVILDTDNTNEIAPDMIGKHVRIVEDNESEEPYLVEGCQERFRTDDVLQDGAQLRREDLYMLAVKSDLMSTTMEVDKSEIMASVYLRCHAEHYDRTIMVTDKGRLVGMFSMAQIFKTMNQEYSPMKKYRSGANG
jgi:H+/Cl- antiporter ClcA